MKVQEKLVGAQDAIRFIAEHDDARIEEVEAALNELSEYIVEQFAFAISRRRNMGKVEEVEKGSAEKRRAKQEAQKGKE